MPVCPHCGEKTIWRKHFSWCWMIGLSLFGLLPGGLYVLRWATKAPDRCTECGRDLNSRVVAKVASGEAAT